MSDTGDIENKEPIKNDSIDQFEKSERIRIAYLGKITQSINKINNLIKNLSIRSLLIIR